MASGLTIVITSNKLPQMILTLPREMDRLVRESVFEMQRVAQIRVAVDTGNLKNSITVAQIAAGVWAVYTAVHYARYVEEGTYRMPARPYLRPGFDAGRAVMERGLKDLERLLS